MLCVTRENRYSPYELTCPFVSYVCIVSICCFQPILTLTIATSVAWSRASWETFNFLPTFISIATNWQDRSPPKSDRYLTWVSKERARGCCYYSLLTKISRAFLLFDITERLDFSANNLNGTIPSELGNLQSILFLYLDENELTGQIPRELAGIRRLGKHSLSFCIWCQAAQKTSKWCQPMLSNLLSLMHLLNTFIKDYLRLYHNNLTGQTFNSISDAFCCSGICITTLAELSADCKGETPEIECSCCTKCLWYIYWWMHSIWCIRDSYMFDIV